MFEAFSTDARAAIAKAQDEALAMDAAEVEVGHLLVGLLLQEDLAADPLWAGSELAIGEIRDTIRENPVGTKAASLQVRPGFSPPAKEVLQIAFDLGLGAPGSDQIMISLLRDRKSGASELLKTAGIDPDKVRFELKRRIQPPAATPSSIRSSGQVVVHEVPGGINGLDFSE